MKTALITGGTRGIGLGISKALAAEGIQLALNGVKSDEKVTKLISDLQAKYKVRVVYCRGNIAEAGEREKVWRQCIDHFSTINYLINNAGVAPLRRMDLLDMDETSYDRVMNINLKGPFFLSQLVAREMLRQKQNHPDIPFAMINISSISSEVVSVGRGQYCISKAGMTMMTRIFAVRMGEAGIPVYEIRPGIIATDMTAEVTEKYDRLFHNDLAIQGRWGFPDDVGRAAASLVRGDFPYSSGQVFHVDGGMTVLRL